MINLATFTAFISEILDASGQVDVLSKNFAKAFDRVDHSVFLQKLGDFDVSKKPILILWSYLCKRQQYVQCSEYRSCIYVLISGVPQGTNLVPLQFLLFINDLDFSINFFLILKKPVSSK